ncbi:MAG: SUMF1/EgtB/PvdO family nonheme iron enzyme [Anaerolineales bacterium]|nr:SUMF1/EgtB/PvdO family nonheme iron enzyme [Anaerolineales bacterium]
MPTPDQQHLIDALFDMRRTPPERAEIGVRLATLGDSRPGVGVRPDGLPDLLWTVVPEGVFLYRADRKREHLPTFRISIYPITYSQFETFLDAPDGFSEPHWWMGLARTEKMPGKAHNTWGNHPRESINWFEAAAFCRWLSVKMNMTIRLPHEREWEKAARGIDGRLYPWGGDYVSGYANVDEVTSQSGSYHLGRTTAVGIYPPTSASPYGAFDMVGNVAEWCTNGFSDEDTTGVSDRVVRGGSYEDQPLNATIPSRAMVPSRLRYERIGFRVVAETT